MKREKIVTAVISFILGFTITSIITYYLIN
jgi:hypothetical protein